MSEVLAAGVDHSEVVVDIRTRCPGTYTAPGEAGVKLGQKYLGASSLKNFSLSELAKKRTYSLNDFHFPFGIWALGFPAHPQTSFAGKQLANYRRLGGLIFNQLQVQRGAVYCSDREPPNYRLVQLLHRATKKTFKQTTTTGL